MSDMNLNADTVLMRTSKLPSAELGPDDVVLLDAERGIYFGLEGPARHIWDYIEVETTFGAICEKLVGEYDVDPQQCERDTRDYILQLVENGLVTTR
jgi:hypothetical protein